MASSDHLSLSWRDTSWIAILNQGNVLDYFSDRSNPFYDRTCNNEVIKMQRLGPEQLQTMTGLEYILLHVQEPILYVIRKQERQAPDRVTALTDYYIIGGTVFQAPDLASVINSRLLNSIHNLQSAADEAQSYSRYHPTKGYSWEFKEKEQTDKFGGKDRKRKNEEQSSKFQRQRVDVLLEELSKKFPLKYPAPPKHEKTDEQIKTDIKQEIKTEKPDDKSTISSQSSAKPPPEKQPKLMR